MTISQLPLDQVVDSAQVALDEIAATLAEFRKSASELDEILADPASHELMGTLNATLMNFQQLAVDFSEGSATNIELQPNSLIFGGSEDRDLEPKGQRE